MPLLNSLEAQSKLTFARRARRLSTALRVASLVSSLLVSSRPVPSHTSGAERSEPFHSVPCVSLPRRIAPVHSRALNSAARARSLRSTAPLTPQRSALTSSGGAHKGKSELLASPAECASLFQVSLKRPPLPFSESAPLERPPPGARERVPCVRLPSERALLTCALFTRRASKHSSCELRCLQVRAASARVNEHAAALEPKRTTCTSRDSPPRHRTHRAVRVHVHVHVDAAMRCECERSANAQSTIGLKFNVNAPERRTEAIDWE